MCKYCETLYSFTDMEERQYPNFIKQLKNRHSLGFHVIGYAKRKKMPGISYCGPIYNSNGDLVAYKFVDTMLPIEYCPLCGNDLSDYITMWDDVEDVTVMVKKA